jgi:hypothetical protein
VADAELIWIQVLLRELGINQSRSPTYGVIILEQLIWLQIQYFIGALSTLKLIIILFGNMFLLGN